MRTLMKKMVIYVVFVIFIFSVSWKVMAALWNAYVPWNYKTDLIGLLLVIPLLAGSSCILAGVMFRVIKNSRKIEK